MRANINKSVVVWTHDLQEVGKHDADQGSEGLEIHGSEYIKTKRELYKKGKVYRKIDRLILDKLGSKIGFATMLC
jgi:hypothetical protein